MICANLDETIQTLLKSYSYVGQLASTNDRFQVMTLGSTLSVTAVQIKLVSWSAMLLKESTPSSDTQYLYQERELKM